MTEFVIKFWNNWSTENELCKVAKTKKFIKTEMLKLHCAECGKLKVSKTTKTNNLD